MRKPRALQPGDRVAIVAPASPCARESFDLGVAAVRDLGFEPVWDESVFARQGYEAGSAEVRTRAFLEAWDDPSVAAVLAARGGYGSVHLLPSLTRERLQQGPPKLFIGYSDTTALLTWLTVGCGITALHGPMLDQRLSRGPEGVHLESFLRALRAEPMGALEPPGLSVIRTGEADGPLFGGNLTQLAASLGTPYAFHPPDGAVLFFEDVNERPYRVDRLVTQLRLAGVLARASAIVWGDMPGCDEPSGTPGVRDTVRALFDGFAGPVIYGFPSGHTSGAAWTLPLGVRVRVSARGTARLTVEEAAVA